jgi:hypothetical protein
MCLFTAGLHRHSVHTPSYAVTQMGSPGARPRPPPLSLCCPTWLPATFRQLWSSETVEAGQCKWNPHSCSCCHQLQAIPKPQPKIFGLQGETASIQSVLIRCATFATHASLLTFSCLLAARSKPPKAQSAAPYKQASAVYQSIKDTFEPRTHHVFDDGKVRMGQDTNYCCSRQPSGRRSKASPGKPRMRNIRIEEV